MRTYLDLLQYILINGRRRPNRTGIDTIGVFGYQARFNLRAGFPLLTTKKMFFRGVAEELFWFLSGSTDARELQAKGVHIWDEWATEEQTARFERETGDLGPVYGWQWRHFGGNYENRDALEYHHEWPNGFDQIKWLVAEILNNPQSRRLIVTGWNPRDANRVALPPCHTFFQFYVQDGELSCHLYQRSADAFLGVPFNIASYALLTHLVAYCTGLRVGDFVHTFGDLHVYVNHMDQVHEQLRREPYPLPRLSIHAETGAPSEWLDVVHARGIRQPAEQVLRDLEQHAVSIAMFGVMAPERALANLLALRFENLVLDGYQCHSALKAEVAL